MQDRRGQPTLRGSTRPKRALRELIRIYRKAIFDQWKRWRVWIGLGWLGVLILLVVIVPEDGRILEALRFEDGGRAEAFAQWSGDASKPHWIPLLTTLFLLVFGVWRSRRQIKHAAVVALISCLVAGVTVNLFRGTLGRPRPYSELADGFYGPSVRHELQSFPSGHAGAAFGYSTALAVVMPTMTVPATLFAVQAGWARMQLNRHRLSDVMVGAAIGLTWGWLLGMSSRQVLGKGGQQRGLVFRKLNPRRWSRLPSRAVRGRSGNRVSRLAVVQVLEGEILQGTTGPGT